MTESNTSLLRKLSTDPERRNACTFLAITTGQGVSNLPPLLELMTPKDRLVWLTSDEAERKRWEEGPRRVLAERCLPTGESLRFGTERELFAALRQKANDFSSDQIILVANGGTKLHFLSAWQALEGKQVSLVYGDQPQCRMVAFPNGPGGRVESAPYRVALTLKEVLTASGHVISHAGRQIWPAEVDLPTPELADQDNLLARTLDIVHLRAESSRNGNPGALTKWGSSREFISDQQINGVIQAMTAFVRGLGKYRGVQTLIDAQRAENSQLGSLFNQILNLAGKAEVNRRNHLLESEFPVPEKGVGELFEDWVSWRLFNLVKNQTAWHGSISEIHCGVKISEKAKLGKIKAEYDQLIVLRNGILLALESKTGAVPGKEMDARAHNIHQVGSTLARMIVVAPLLTECTDRPWFEYHVRFMKDLQRHGKRFLPMTIPGQADAYSDMNEDGSFIEQSVPSFEEAMKGEFEKYLPSREFAEQG